MSTEDDRLHDLLHSAVGDVEPRLGVDAIRRRTRRRSPRGWGWGAGGALVATAATIAAVAALGHGGTPGDRPQAPGGGSPTSSADHREDTVYLAGSTGAGPRLFPEQAVTPGSALDLAALLDDTVQGRSDDTDYGTLWPIGTRVRSARLADGIVTVDLAGPVVDRPAGTSRSEAGVALQQVVRTAQLATRSAARVRFLLDGHPTGTVLGEPGKLPVAAAADDDVLSPVTVTAPVQGDQVVSPVTVTGRASAFEATVQWELLRDGAVVRRGYATARECCTLSPYSFRLTAAPGTYTLVVHDEDVSGGEGGQGTGTTRDTKTFTVLSPDETTAP
jgi:hypothetical protein